MSKYLILRDNRKGEKTMMHLEFKKQDYRGCHIDIQPAHRSEIAGLRNMVVNNFNVINPAKIFADKMKSGFFDGVPEEKVEAEAEVVNVLSELWDGEYCMNVMMLLARAMQEIVNEKLGG